jgi:hypothetical protein
VKPRMNFYQAAPDTIKALSALEAQVQASGLEQSLIELTASVRGPRRAAPGSLLEFFARQRARGMPGARCTRSLVCSV